MATASHDDRSAGAPLEALVHSAADFGPGSVGHEPVEPVRKAENRQLYKDRVKVYPKLVHGRFRKVKWLILATLLTGYYLLPWLRWDRGPTAPDQAVLFDIASRRFYFFWIEVWPQEIYYLTGILILAALSLFLVTSVAGRVWCGYTCPQTLWTDLFIHVERLIEGDRNRRMRSDKAPWTTAKVLKKSAKHLVWLAIAVATGGAWVFYFADAPTLALDLLAFQAPTPAYVFIGVFTVFTYMLGGIAREQVCIYMCPWPRIQGAMVDEDSLLVSYREDRGEPRGPHKRGASWDGRGDCVDCHACVAACPMGIDIRDGFQLECIQCALCIDACNDIMDRVDRPRGLIAYETFTNLDRRARGAQPVYRLLRPRVWIYVAAIAVVGAIMTGAMWNRSDLDVTIIRDRNPLFILLSDGSVRNRYTVKILNKAHEDRVFDISVRGLDDARLSLNSPFPADGIAAPSDRLTKLDYLVTLPKPAADTMLADGTAPLEFILIERATGTIFNTTSSFKGPAQ